MRENEGDKQQTTFTIETPYLQNNQPHLTTKLAFHTENMSK